MRVGERWLREWCDPGLDTAALAAAFTGAGLEVESLERLPALSQDIVIATVLDVGPHPNADRLRVCRVQGGVEGPVLTIVCGAPNVRAGMSTALARIGTTLPGGLTIKAARIRGAQSEGMLCSAQELGLPQDGTGILDLPALPPGTPLNTALGLGDAVLGFGLTPNRGDCLSVRGLARELAALSGVALRAVAIPELPAEHARTVPVRLDDPAACPRYVCRVLSGVDSAATTPLWLRERLQRSGLRSLGAVVDITNYVMLELGQPLHAFDLEKIAGGISVRMARPGENLTLLDGTGAALDTQTLVIADDQVPLAIAGVMGGADSAVGAGTREVLLEGAYFAPRGIGSTARRLDRLTDAAMRFERGADPQAQCEAIERATELLKSICGARPGPVVHAQAPKPLPPPAQTRLRRARIGRVLGCELDPAWCSRTLQALGIVVREQADGWCLTPPTWRTDLALEEDYIEELARLHGYTRLPVEQPAVRTPLAGLPETRTPARTPTHTLIVRGYHEAVTYSFADPALCRLLDAEHEALALANPLSAELAVLRTSLWPGLVQAAAHNLRRQEPRVRLFELGPRFLRRADGSCEERATLAGLITGTRLPEQWGAPVQPVDFYDLKGDLEAILDGTGAAPALFTPAAHNALHPGQCAVIRRADTLLGVCGRLHPRLEEQLDLPPVWVFELDFEALCTGRVPVSAPVLRLPSVRRDLAVVVDLGVPAQAILDTLRAAAGGLLRELVLFDVYTGPGIAPGHKSIAVGLKLADAGRTLTDTDVEAIVSGLLRALEEQHGAHLREAHGTHQS